MEEVPEHILRVQNIFHDELGYEKPVNTYLTDTLQNHFIQSLKNEITKTGNYTESVNTILFTKNNREYYFRKQDGEIFDVSKNTKLTPNEIESLFNIVIRYHKTLPPDKITLEESKEIISKMFQLDVHPTLIEDEIPIEKLKEICLDTENNDIIIGPLGSRKTRNTIAALKESKQKFIFLVPTIPLMNELSKDDNINLRVSTSSTSDAEIETILSDSLGVITYFDGFTKLNKYLKDKWDFILVVDEYHTLTLHSDFRKIVKEITREMWNYKKIIQLSGTPYGCLTDAESFKITNFKYASLKPRRFNYKIIPHKLTDRDPHVKFIDLIINHVRESQGKVIIFYNDKDIIDEIKVALKLYAGFQENEIAVFKSQDKDDYDSEDSLESIELDKVTKIILTTSIIASGVSFMADDYESILIFNVPNFLDVFQLLGRPRNNKNVINVFDFIPGLNEYKTVNYSELLSERIELFKNAEYFFNKLLTDGFLDNSYTHHPDKEFIQTLTKKIPLFSLHNNGFKADLEFVYNSVMEEVGKFSFEYPEIRKWIFEQLGVNATIEEFQEAPTVADRQAIKDEQNKIERDNLNSILELLKNNYDEVITYCKSKNLINKEIVPNLKYKSKESVESIEQHKQVLRTHKDTINLYLLLKQNELPVNNAINFIRINFDHNNKLLKACEFISLSKSVDAHSPGENKDFATGIDHFIQRLGSEPITLEDFKKKIKHYAGSSNLAKHFAAAPKICFAGVYEFKLYSGNEVKRQKNKSLYKIVWQPYNQKIDSIISYYKLGAQFKDGNNRTRRSFNSFIKNL